MSFFDNVGRALASTFNPLYPDGTLHKIIEETAPNGDVSTRDRNVPVKAKRDSVTEAMKTDPGFASTDVAIYVLNKGLSLTITTDDEITAEGIRYQIGGPIRKDTAGSHFILRGVLTP